MTKNTGETYRQYWQKRHKKHGRAYIGDISNWNDEDLTEQQGEQFWSQLEPRLPDPEHVQTVLDFGCGWGRMTRKLKDKYPDADVYGVDMVPGAIETAQATIMDCTFACDSRIPGDFPNFDLIVTCTVLQHVTDPTTWELLCADFENRCHLGGRLLMLEELGDNTAKHVANHTLISLRQDLSGFALHKDAEFGEHTLLIAARREDNIAEEAIKRITPIPRDEQPLISALMVTGKLEERRPLADKAVECFHNQKYDNRELLVVNTSPTAPWFEGQDRVREIVVEQGSMQLGDLRNRAYDEAAGDLWMQWDDDDWHHPNRMAWQQKHHRPGTCSILRRQYRIDLTSGEWGLAVATESKFRGIAGTMLHEATDYRYPSVAMGEDVEFLDRYHEEGTLHAYSNPACLYVRLYHGTNTWDRAHVMRPTRKREGNEDLILRLRRLYTPEQFSVLTRGCSFILGWEHAGELHTCLAMPKCGMTSMLGLMADRLKLPSRGKHFMSRRWRIIDLCRQSQLSPSSFAILRDPVERGISAWWARTQTQKGYNMAAANRQIRDRWDAYGDLFFPDMPLRAFVDALEEIPVEQAEDHFRPYSHIIHREGTPAKYVRLGDARDWATIMEKTGLAPLPVLNRKGRGRPTVASIPADLRRRLERYYARDIDLWRSLS